jgi:hypothetical protein
VLVRLGEVADRLATTDAGSTHAGMIIRHGDGVVDELRAR